MVYHFFFLTMPGKNTRMILRNHHGKIIQSDLIMSLKDVRTHCYCAFLLHMLFIRHVCATSYIKHAHRAKHLTKCSADGRCVNFVREYFCWMHGDPHLFFGRSLTFLIISIITKNKRILCIESCNYFTFTIQMGSNFYINTGVRDLEVHL